MEQHFNTPSEVIDTNMKAGEGKAHLPLGKMILLGIMAGAFIALGGATSSTAAHAIDNVGLARFVAGIIFPVGLMIIVFVGGELFTGNCLIVMDVVGKKVTWFECIRNLIVVYFSNLIGALIIDTLIYFSGNLDYTGGLLGAYAIKVAVGKVGISPLKGITSGILCNILVFSSQRFFSTYFLISFISFFIFKVFFEICSSFNLLFSYFPFTFS